MLAQSTRENVYGYLPNNETFFHTPTTGTSGGSNSRKALAKRILKYPTPTTPSGGGNVGGSGAYHNAIKHGTHIPHSINPNQYEWLMGWPIGWTDLKPLEMDKCHYAQQPPSPYLEKD
jgi:DNA (cytosine-5)-methyltransferase 1